MLRNTILTIAIAAAAAPVAHAQTGVPALNHSCPSSSAVKVTAKAGGPVFIDGKQASVKKISAAYFEASGTAPRITVSIMVDRGGSASVSYTGPGKLNGICQPMKASAPTPAKDSAARTRSRGAPVGWPASLPAVGSGFPKTGDACRVVGETAATVNFLDDSATLVGCLSPADAVNLGGTRVGLVDGVTLVSVPARRLTAGDGDGQGDAKVAGTDYNATAQVRCVGYKGAAAGLCKAGVKRGTETGSYVDIELPDGRQRTIFFDGQGKFLAFGTAEADGTAAMKAGSRRDGDTTIATLGSERYEIPDVFVQGD